MQKFIVFILILFIVSCSNRSKYNIEEYHKLTNQAELSICFGDYSQASKKYVNAFKKISKPFGSDVFNAALVNQLSQNITLRDEYLMILINNLEDHDIIRETFIGKYMSRDSFDLLMSFREIDYNITLRNEFREIEKRDQLFRPMYETHDSIIESNRIFNMKRITNLTDSIGFPCHIELGYTESLLRQKHDIVFLHTAFRRSRNKNISDLEPLLYSAVNEGRLDPEDAIFYLNGQNDRDKRDFEAYSGDQIIHHLLPDSLNNKLWLRNLDSVKTHEANRIRKKWYADNLEDIEIKMLFKIKSNLPFVFTSVRVTTGYMPEDFDLKKALEQYKLGTTGMKYLINSN